MLHIGFATPKTPAETLNEHISGQEEQIGQRFNGRTNYRREAAYDKGNYNRENIQGPDSKDPSGQEAWYAYLAPARVLSKKELGD
jgi:hypothetical protein